MPFWLTQRSRQELLWLSWRLENDFVSCSKLYGNDTTVGGVKEDQIIFTLISVILFRSQISNVNPIISSTERREKNNE